MPSDKSNSNINFQGTEIPLNWHSCRFIKEMVAHKTHGWPSSESAYHTYKILYLFFQMDQDKSQILHNLRLHHMSHMVKCG